ncbi:hypothetical protein Tco_0654833 [Tanacetum coccineum]|uniref:Reverse transcriptase domain-containing protein n=1 Tax=Tanacetum coccineum TaxID=301880 RepID=A0ABQ4X4C0_9ASTR
MGVGRTTNENGALWPNLHMDFINSSSIGASGGLLTVWDSCIFSKENSYVDHNFVGVIGSGKKEWVANLTMGRLINLMISYSVGHFDFSLGDRRFTRFDKNEIKVSKLDRLLASYNFFKAVLEDSFAMFKGIIHERPRFSSPMFYRLSSFDVSSLEACISMEEIKDDVWWLRVEIEELDSSVPSIGYYLGFDNGSPSNEFKMEGGLRQWDPLSPFLFLLVDESVQIFILKACSKGLFRDIQLANNGANLSLIQYADDALFFGDWSRLNTKNLIYFLKFFESASSLKINISKSMLFGIGVPTDDVVFVASLLDCSRDSLPFIYPRLSVGKRMNLCDGWVDVLNLFGDRLSAWKANFLSISGRLTLRKSMLGSLLCRIGFHLRDILHRLYALESDKICKVIDHWKLVNDVWGGGGNWSWRLSPCSSAIDDISSLVKELVRHIQNSSLVDCVLGYPHIWNSWIPRKKKISITTWLDVLWCFWFREKYGVGGICLNPSSSLLFPLVIVLGKFCNLRCSINNKVIKGVFHCTLWAIWKWHNKLVNAMEDSTSNIKDEDIFLFIQRITRTWISTCSSSKSLIRNDGLLGL